MKMPALQGLGQLNRIRLQRAVPPALSVPNQPIRLGSRRKVQNSKTQREKPSWPARPDPFEECAPEKRDGPVFLLRPGQIQTAGGANPNHHAALIEARPSTHPPEDRYISDEPWIGIKRASPAQIDLYHPASRGNGVQPSRPHACRPGRRRRPTFPIQRNSAENADQLPRKRHPRAQVEDRQSEICRDLRVQIQLQNRHISTFHGEDPVGHPCHWMPRRHRYRKKGGPFPIQAMINSVFFDHVRSRQGQPRRN